MGANVKEFLHLVEEFVDMVGLQMSGFQDIYEVTENLGETPPPSTLHPPHPPCLQLHLLHPSAPISATR